MPHCVLCRSRCWRQPQSPVETDYRDEISPIIHHGDHASRRFEADGLLPGGFDDELRAIQVSDFFWAIGPWALKPANAPAAITKAATMLLTLLISSSFFHRQPDLPSSSTDNHGANTLIDCRFREPEIRTKAKCCSESLSKPVVSSATAVTSIALPSHNLGAI
jgi:hypothetical protein